MKTKEQIVNPSAKQCTEQKLECMLQSQFNIDNLKSKIYFCQWVHYDNRWKIKTY